MKSVKRHQRLYSMLPLAKIKELEPLKEEFCRYKRMPRRSVSCPCILPSQARAKVPDLPWTRSAIFSSTRQRSDYKTILNNHFAKTQIRSMANVPNQTAENYSSVKKLGTICACPSPGSSCCSCSLPPPCNTPAKCLQYMRGYYYYPYGTWFCGPYHVSTGQCGPCSGPVKPGGPCCPAAPCPGGPCGPVGVSPCGPCGPCSPSCACGPLGCCGVCGMGPNQNFSSSYPGPYGFNPYGNSPFTHVCNYNGPFGPFGPPNQYNPYQMYNQWEDYNQAGPGVPFNNGVQFSGPFYNVPCQIPVQVGNTGAPASGGAPRPSNPTRKCCVVWPLPKSESGNEAVHPMYPPSQPLSSPSAPCPKNLHPKSLPLSAPSRFDINPSMTRNQSVQKPRYNGRAMDQILTQACVLPTNIYPIRMPNEIKFKSILNAACKYFCNAEKNRIHETRKRS